MEESASMEIQIETASINNEDQIAILGGNEKKKWRVGNWY